jgi:hypothetical protein
MTQHRTTAPELCAAIAYHEAGHAVAHVMAYREAHLPDLKPAPSVKYARIIREDVGKASGICYGSRVYRPEYAARLPDWRWGHAMEWEIVINMAGGVAEAIYRGERRQREVMWFALMNCGTEGDLDDAEVVLADLNRLTRRRYGLQRFTIRALKLLLANWDAVEVIAATLIRDQHVDGAEIERAVRS